MTDHQCNQMGTIFAEMSSYSKHFREMLSKTKIFIIEIHGYLRLKYFDFFFSWGGAKKLSTRKKENI